MRWSWLAVGALALVGSVWLVLRVLLVLGFYSEATPYLAYFGGALLTGAIVARHIEVKPWREPLFATLLGYVIMFALWRVGNDRGWLLAQSLPLALVIGGGSAIAAVAGAAAVRALATTEPTRAATVILSAQMLGASMFLLLVLGLDVGLISLMGSWMIGGMVTQLVTPKFRPLSCSGGVIIYLLVAYAFRAFLLYAVIGTLFMWLVGAFGAAIGWKLARRTAPVEVPAARLQ